jgi:hypothetical protein
MEIRIQTFNELIEYIHDHKPTPELLTEIVRQAFKTLWINCPNDVDAQVRILSEFWERWQNEEEKPVFLNIDISLKEEDEK